MTVLAMGAPILALTKEERLFLWIGVLVGVLILGGIIISRIDRWRKRQMEDRDDAPEHLGSFRAMYENGELSREEYERVLHRMAAKVGAKPKPTPTPPAASPPASESSTNQEPPAAPAA
jgi:hypothetical protein